MKIGMIGAGGIAKNVHGKALKHLSDKIEVIAVSDIHDEAATALAKELNTPAVFTDYKQLLKMDEIEAVIITTPNFLHSIITLEALEAGKHVLCEKPLAVNSLEAEQMVRKAQQQGKVLMTALNNRYREDVLFLKKLSDEGTLGDIYHAKCGWVRRSGIPGWGGWFTNQSLSGGGPLIDLGVHMLDVTLYLMGDPKVHSVSGATYKKFGHKGHTRTWSVANSKGLFDVEDYATGFIRLENGATISLDASWAANIEKEHTYVDLLGDQSGIHLSNQTGIQIFSEKNGEVTTETPDIPFHDGIARINMWEHFLECVNENKEPLSSGERGLAINRILDALYESSETRKEVLLP